MRVECVVWLTVCPSRHMEGVFFVPTRVYVAVSVALPWAQIKLLASPTFSMVTSTYNDKEGIALLNDVIAAITAEMKKYRGSVVVKLAVRGVWPAGCAGGSGGGGPPLQSTRQARRHRH